MIGPRILGICTLLAIVSAAGCLQPLFRTQSPEDVGEEFPEVDVKVVADVTHPLGLNYIKIEAVSLATGLAGTGSDPPPSPQRAALLAEMKRREVDRPAEVLASENTSLVLVRAFLPPGIQKGDRFDVEIRVPSRSDTTSLRGGKLLESRLTELAVLDHKIRRGHVFALAKGPILVDPTATEDEAAIATRGRVLGGGVAKRSRSLGLVIDDSYKSIRLSRRLGKVINERFHKFDNGQKQGIANPKTDGFVELSIHPRYKDNVNRYMRVIGQLALDEELADRQRRIRLLDHQLRDPLTAATAALRLEAIGDEPAIEVLRGGLEVEDPEVRFYAAEALAYLDVTAAVEAVAEIARDEPAFRVNALAALSAMDDPLAYEALRALLDSPSAETRYGAFRALWAMNPDDPVVRKIGFNAPFSYHIVPSAAGEMVHVTWSHHPEIVLFGGDSELRLPLILDAGKLIVINGLDGGELTVSRFQPGEPVQKRVVAATVDSMIRAIVDLGGTYPDVVQALQQARSKGGLTCRLRVDALPESGRSFDRPDEESVAEAETASKERQGYRIATPLPNLFGRN